jgi:hypothetical protein
MDLEIFHVQTSHPIRSHKAESTDPILLFSLKGRLILLYQTHLQTRSIQAKKGIYFRLATLLTYTHKDFLM